MATMKRGRERRRKTGRCAPAASAFSSIESITLLLLVSALAIATAGFTHFRGAVPKNAGLQTLRSEVDLVVLPVTVTDRKGRFVSSLAESDFQVFENGQPQTISRFSHNDVPVTVGLVVDSSGSMGANRAEVVQAAKDFLTSSNPQDQIFVVNFNERASLGLPPGEAFTSNVAQLEEAVQRGPSTGMTALYDATALALRHLAGGTNDKKALIIISDGGDNASREKFRQVLKTAQHSSAIFYTIGIINDAEADVNPGVLRKLAKATGGEAYFPKSAQELPGICEEIAHDLREQYSIAYVPADKAHDGKYRAIRVTAHAPGRGTLVVRARAGYYAPSAAAETTEAKQGG
jgi:Ca-activated chloride channel homolog